MGALTPRNGPAGNRRGSVTATSTVEDYIKCIYVEEQRADGELVSTGRIAAAMGVAPGSVTAMIKTLDDSRLVTYERYVGVRLSEAGCKLATHILRRHRLVELFLVKIMSMDWSVVHAEAEILEHAVSDQLIERMDEMLGHPSVDPHGDPIPTAGGSVDESMPPSLLDSPLNTRLAVARVTDQRAQFLQLLQRHRLTPGRRAVIETRDKLAETVSVRPEEGEALQLGFQAASRILVRPL